MPLNTEMPAWLGERADMEWKNAADVADNFSPYMDYMRGEQTKIAVEGAKMNLASGILGLQQQKQQINLQQMVMQDKEQGIKEYPEWLKSTGGDPEKMLTTPFTGTSQSAAQQVQQTQLAAWQRSIQKQAVTAKLTETEAKIKIAKMSADAKMAWVDMQGQIATIRANATKAGKGAEFETLLSDYQKNMDLMTQKSQDPNADPDELASLQDTISLEKDRLNKLGKFAGEIPTVTETDTTTETDPTDPNKKVTKVVRKTGPASNAAPKAKKDSFKVGGFTVTPQ